MTREAMGRAFAARVVDRAVRQLLEDIGVMLGDDAEAILHDVVADEYLATLAPEGEAERVVDEASRHGLALDDDE